MLDLQGQKGVFVVGTDTDVGKTYVSGLIMKMLLENNINAGYFKAALSGDDGNFPTDNEYVMQIAGISEKPFVPYVYKNALSPHLSSKLEGNPVEMNVVKSAFETAQERYDFILAEGSGGIICPLRYDKVKIMLSDVISMTGFGIVIVADAGLGTINHTMLTIKYAQSIGIKVLGVILNRYEKENIMHIDNGEMITMLTGIGILGCVSKNGEFVAISP